MITNTGYKEQKDVMAYLAHVPFDVSRKSLYHPTNYMKVSAPTTSTRQSPPCSSSAVRRQAKEGKFIKQLDCAFFF